MAVNGLIHISSGNSNGNVEGIFTTEDEADGSIEQSIMYDFKDDSTASVNLLSVNSLIDSNQIIGLYNAETSISLNGVKYLKPKTLLKEIISYQRFGKIDRTVYSNLNFKCHLCGFSCAMRETLLKHFDEEHPI